MLFALKSQSWSDMKPKASQRGVLNLLEDIFPESEQSSDDDDDDDPELDLEDETLIMSQVAV